MTIAPTAPVRVLTHQMYHIKLSLVIPIANEIYQGTELHRFRCVKTRTGATSVTNHQNNELDLHRFRCMRTRTGATGYELLTR